MVQERRSEPRYERRNHQNLSLRVKRASGILSGFRKPRTATWMDFNRHGMGFESAERHRVGARVLLDLSMEDKGVSDVVAVVCNTRRSNSGQYRHGVRFDFKANIHMRSEEVEQAIEGIEGTLRRVLSERH